MIVQSVTVPVIVISLARESPRLHQWAVDVLIPIFVWLTVVVTTLSMIAYLVRAKNILKEMSRTD